MGIVQPPDHPAEQLRLEPVIVPEAVAEAPPIPGIFQPSFQLTRADFMMLQSPSRFWTGLGRVLLTFSVVYALPKGTGLIRSGTKVEAADWWTIGVIFALGLVCFGVSWIFSFERRSVLKSIKQFFKDNPGQPVHRPGRR